MKTYRLLEITQPQLDRVKAFVEQTTGETFVKQLHRDVTSARYVGKILKHLFYTVYRMEKNLHVDIVDDYHGELYEYEL